MPDKKPTGDFDVYIYRLSQIAIIFLIITAIATMLLIKYPNLGVYFGLTAIFCMVITLVLVAVIGIFAYKKYQSE